MSRKTTTRYQEAVAENRTLKAHNERLLQYIREHERIATEALEQVSKTAQHMIDAVLEDLNVALAIVNQREPHNDVVFQEVQSERARQDAEHGPQLHCNDVECHLWTMEEVGEVTKALNELYFYWHHLVRQHDPNMAFDPLAHQNEPAIKAREQALYTEIIHAAACYIKWAQTIRAREAGVREVDYDFTTDPAIANLRAAIAAARSLDTEPPLAYVDESDDRFGAPVSLDGPKD